MQYETWLKKVITAISEEYELPKEDADNLFKKILYKLKQVIKNR